ncbi:MAG: pilus assembly protein TadG-related protein [Alphaproteobacteria bacterium]|jgi:Flp pilus assembly protein TadG|nr:pilus assembly protein TadG-related protein [Alphaproteobacteria bacterium]
MSGFWKNENGSIGMFFALALIPVVGFVGIAYDSARIYSVKSRLSESLDAAGLAAGRAVFSPTRDAEATMFFNANFPDGYMDSTVAPPTIAVDEAGETITVTGSATVPTTFMRLFGNEDVVVSARSVIVRQNRGMELALVMDNTGSMRSGGKIDAMKSASRDLIDIIYGDDETVNGLYVALVPYTATVNVGADRSAWLDAGDRYFDSPSPFEPTEWKGCVEARTAPLDQNDTPPAVEPFTSYYFAADVDNQWPAVDESNGAQNDGTGPNLGCGPEITSLVAEKSVVTAAIDEMLPWHRGGTTSNLGLVWGWRVLSPAWRGLWSNGGDPVSPMNLPLDYDDPLMDKVVVVLTDGQNQFYDWPNHSPNNGVGPEGSDYTAYGRLNEFGYATLAEGLAEINTRFSNICTAMKAQGIVIFSITFGPSPNAATQDLYRNCATQPDYYYHSPSNDQLADAFHSIGQILTNLRVAE